MGKRNKWTVEVDGVKHIIEYKKGFKCKLVVDNNEKVLKSKNPFIILIEETINLGSKNVKLVVIGAKPDLVVDGIYLNTKKEYVPIKELPKWTWIFAGACMLPIIVFLGGIFNGIFGAFGVLLCLSASLSQKSSTVTKVILNVIITVIVWSADIAMMSYAMSVMK